MGLLSKEQIWAAGDLVTKDVPVPEWGGEVRLRSLTGAERDQYEADSIKTGKGGRREHNLSNLRARLIALCAIDDNGNPLFTRGDVMRLGQKSALALERLFDEATKLNGMSDEDVEELAGNSESGQSDSSTSA